MKVIIRVKIGELLLRNSELELLEVTQELGEHTTCRVEFTRDESQAGALDTLLRAPVTVTVQEDDGDLIEIFQGVVRHGVQSHLLHVGSRFVLDCVSPSVRHELRATRHFPRGKLGAIASALGARLVAKLNPEPPPFDYVQWGETEFAFLKRLADEHSCFLHTSGPAVEIRNEFQDREWRLVWGNTLLEITAGVGLVNHGVTGASYDLTAKSAHIHAGVRSSPATLGGAGKLVAAAAAAAPGFADGGDPILIEPFAVSTDHGDFKARLRRESERALGGAVRIEAASGTPGLQAGDLVEIGEGLDFRVPTTGKLGIVRIVHTFQDQQYLNRFTATPWKTFSAFTAPARVTIGGAVSAQVVANQDPSGMGRVQIQYQWSAGDQKSYWARLASPHGGNGRGMMFVPEVGDEVLVCFLGGDPEQPVVVGSLWNGKDKAPPQDQDNTWKRLITRSGNTIQFSDEGGKETVEVFTAEGKTSMQLKGGGKPVITIQSQGDIAIEAPQGELRLKSQTFTQEVTAASNRKIGAAEFVDVAQNLTLKAGMDLIAAGLNVALKGGATVESVAGAMNSIVGGVVQIQPPGFAGKQIAPQSISVDKTDLGDRPKPEKAAPVRSADPATPRQV